MTEDIIKVRDLNDRFRRGDPSVPGQVLITPGVVDLIDQDEDRRAALFQIVQQFDKFDADNDPHKEHDFGAFTFQEAHCFWKLDIYDVDFEMAPLDATDPKLSRRVLTIMRAEEY